jgi:hypothetical protein
VCLGWGWVSAPPPPCAWGWVCEPPCGVHACMLFHWDMSCSPEQKYCNKTGGMEGVGATFQSIYQSLIFSVSLLPLAIFPLFFQNSCLYSSSFLHLSFLYYMLSQSFSFPFLLKHCLMMQIYHLFFMANSKLLLTSLWQSQICTVYPFLFV